MGIRILLITFILSASFLSAQDVIIDSSITKNLKLKVVTQFDSLRFNSTKPIDIFSKNNIDYKILRVVPNSGIDYKIKRKLLDKNINYKILSVKPSKTDSNYLKLPYIKFKQPEKKKVK